MKDVYSEIQVVQLPKFKIARYVMISPNPEEDVIAYMDRWAERSGLLQVEGYVPKRIGWDFPHVSREQSEQYGLRGYVSAYVVPEDFLPKCEGAEMAYIEADAYAMLTVTDPHSASFEKIPKGYQMLMAFADTEAYRISTWENRYAFEEEYDREGVHYMDIYLPVK